MERNWKSNGKPIDPRIQKIIENLFPPPDVITPEEQGRLELVKQRYDKGDLSENVPKPNKITLS